MNHPEQGVYLVWKWDWIVSPQICTESPTCEAPQSRTESPMGEYEHDLSCVGDSDEETDTFHMVRFKCMMFMMHYFQRASQTSNLDGLNSK